MMLSTSVDGDPTMCLAKLIAIYTLFPSETLKFENSMKIFIVKMGFCKESF